MERAEKRKDSQLAREIELSLPRDLTPRQREHAVRDYVQPLVELGMVCDVCIHNPRASDGGEQPHAHILITMRPVGPKGFGQKNREWNRKEFLVSERARWASVCNLHLARAGVDARTDHRSLEDQGIDRIPQRKNGVGRRARKRGQPSIQSTKEDRVKTINRKLQFTQQQIDDANRAQKEWDERFGPAAKARAQAQQINIAELYADEPKVTAAKKRYQDKILDQAYGGRELPLSIRMSVARIDHDGWSQTTTLRFRDGGNLIDNGALHQHKNASDDALRAGAAIAVANGWDHVKLKGDADFMYRASIVYGRAGLAVHAIDQNDAGLVQRAQSFVAAERAAIDSATTSNAFNPPSENTAERFV